MKDRLELSFDCDTDQDRHGIVIRSARLLQPNHNLSVAIFYLFQHPPKWRRETAIGKTVVSSQMIDRITAKLSRKLYEVPVGFKRFVDVFRPSGTEDINKIYAESFRGADHLHRILEEAQTIVNDALASAPQQPGIPAKTNAKEKP